MTPTAVNTEALRNKVATRDEGEVGETIYDLLEKQKPQLQRALPRAMNADRFARIVLTEVRRTPKLLTCSPASLLGSLMYAASLGVEPGPLGQAWLVPFWDNKARQNQVQFILGYRGMIDLALRDGKVKSIVAREVYTKDHFEVDLGTDERIVHKPCITGERGTAYLYYGVAKLANGETVHHVMRRDDIERIRARSKAGEKGPWETDYDAMARKTVIRQMSKYLPLSVETATAIDVDEAVHEWRPDAKDDEVPIATRRVDELPEGDASQTDGPPSSELEPSGEKEGEGTGTPDPGAPPSPSLLDEDPVVRAVALVELIRSKEGGVATALKRALTTLLNKIGVPEDLSSMDPDQANAILDQFANADG